MRSKFPGLAPAATCSHPTADSGHHRLGSANAGIRRGWGCPAPAGGVGGAVAAATFRCGLRLLRLRLLSGDRLRPGYVYNDAYAYEPGYTYKLLGLHIWPGTHRARDDAYCSAAVSFV